MNPVWQSRVGTVVCVLGVVLFPWSLAAGAEEGQTGQQRSDQLLLEIMDMHTRLATNEVFLAQAGVVATYLEAAHESDEPMKIEIYGRVQKLLSKIQLAAARDSQEPKELKPDSGKPSAQAQSDEGATTYKRGQALLEIFNGESLSQLPELPVIRTYWRQDLACKSFPVAGRQNEVGRDYVAKFTFWYEAVQPGKYSFTLAKLFFNVFSGMSDCILRIGGVDVVKSSGGAEQGVCTLEKGFHRVEFLVIIHGDEPNFQVKILVPGALDSVPFTQDMMLLKKE